MSFIEYAIGLVVAGIIAFLVIESYNQRMAIAQANGDLQLLSVLSSNYRYQHCHNIGNLASVVINERSAQSLLDGMFGSDSPADILDNWSAWQIEFYANGDPKLTFTASSSKRLPTVLPQTTTATASTGSAVEYRVGKQVGRNALENSKRNRLLEAGGNVQC